MLIDDAAPAAAETVRIVVVDDHPVVRDGLIGMFTAMSSITVVGQAASGREALEMVATCDPDVVLMDLRMPDGDGFSAISRLRARNRTRPRILVLTTYDTERDVHRALAAGADGFLLKDARHTELIRAVHDLAEGRAAVAPGVLAMLARRDAAPALTEREANVLRLAADGLTNRAIGHRLAIGEATVKTHLQHVYAKLGAPDRAAAVRIAWERGLV